MSKRMGLGKGLGAFFGEDYEITTEGITENKADAHAEIKTGNKENNKSEYKTVGERKKAVTKPTAAKMETKPVEKIVEKVVEKIVEVEVEKEKFLNISLIEPNREQPRKNFNEEQLKELAESIKEYGILQPLLVQKKGDYYEIIAGERRWRAAKLAGLKEIPVVIREYSKQRTMEIALIENVQRADLNPIEEAKAYQILVQEFGMKQEDVAVRVSKNRATITNSLRLLKLDERVQELLIGEEISGGHARTLLSLEDKEKQYQVAKRIIENQLSVRETEKLVKLLTTPSKKVREPKAEERDMNIFYRDLEDKLKSAMGTKVIINKKDKNKGRIEIEYYSSAELERLAELLQSINN
ncbi:MAG: ParB/RepB/Spo0J family partition protein [Clostridium sp.]